MESAVLMVLLTLQTGSGLAVSFAETAGRPACEERMGRVQAILRLAPDVSVVDSGCYPSNARFEPFDHAPPADTPRRHYLVVLDEGPGVIELQKDATACAVALGNVSEGSRRYCASSYQGRID